MNNNDFEYAIKQYEALTSRFPFTDQARQARLDLIYVYYRKGEKESATDAADQFLRENPTHPRIDYAWYMKGMIDFERTPYAIERWFGVDMARRPPASALKSIAAFNTVVTQFPKSDYAQDALRAPHLPAQPPGRIRSQCRALLRQARRLSGGGAARAGRHRSIRRRAGRAHGAVALLLECYQRSASRDLAANVQRVYAANYTGNPRNALSPASTTGGCSGAIPAEPD